MYAKDSYVDSPSLSHLQLLSNQYRCRSTRLPSGQPLSLAFVIYRAQSQRHHLHIRQVRLSGSWISLFGVSLAKPTLYVQVEWLTILTN